MRQRGFTLIELSIVLVIIGLLVGGVMAGQSMIRASQLRNAVSEYGKYAKAIGEFRDKYYALPGDMNNAEAIWGSDPTGCSANDSNPKIATCNGNGNGHIGDSTMDGTLSSSREWFRAWQQLGDAGFIEGHFSGAPGGGGVAEATVGTNVPKSALRGAGWTLLFYLFPANTSADNGILWRDQYGHIFILGGPASASFTSSPALSPNEALYIDKKTDDGKPGRGKIRAFRTSLNSNANCTENDTTQDAQTYKTHDQAACALVFIGGF